MARWLVALVVLVAAACGCGDEDSGREEASDEDQVRSVAERYAAAIDAGDAVSACELEIQREGCVPALQEELARGSSLADGYGPVARVQIDGDVAKASFEDGGFIALSRVDGSWRVGAPDGAGENLGFPAAPRTKKCPEKIVEKFRRRLEKSGRQLPEGGIFCGTASFQDSVPNP